jgi:hypothetical protein
VGAPPAQQTGQQPSTGQSAPANASTAASANTSGTANIAGGFTVQVKARGESIWTKSKVDDGDSTEVMLKADEVREFKPAQRLSILLSRSKLNALEVSINNRPAKVTPEPRGGLAEIIITKENYAQLSQ